MIDLSHAQRLVVEAEFADPTAERFLTAYRAAQQACLAALAASPRRHRGRAEAWSLLAAAAPELAEWAHFFGALTPKALAVQAGATTVVGAREADDLVRAAQQFLLHTAGWLRRRERAEAEAG